MIHIEILIDADTEDPFHAAGIAENDIRDAVQAAARVGDCDDVHVGVRVTMDRAIHAVNRQFLQHDYPTDVISFPYDLSPPRVEGELVVSLETAMAQASDAGWSVKDEILLYIVHGTLHLVGFDDTADDVRVAMRQAERDALGSLGIVVPDAEASPSDASPSNASQCDASRESVL